jgi:outer membrane protein assembly factor BamD (BamD/ComL family)
LRNLIFLSILICISGCSIPFRTERPPRRDPIEIYKKINTELKKTNMELLKLNERLLDEVEYLQQENIKLRKFKKENAKGSINQAHIDEYMEMFLKQTEK